MTFLFCVGGFILSSIVCIPDWPIYNRHPLHWQPAEKIPGTIVDGVPVPDTNQVCGACVCGVNVHGVTCESNSDFNKTKSSDPNSPTGVDSPSDNADVAEMVEVKGRSKASGKKK